MIYFLVAYFAVGVIAACVAQSVIEDMCDEEEDGPFMEDYLLLTCVLAWPVILLALLTRKSK